MTQEDCFDTTHRIIAGNAAAADVVAGSADLVVTSPPYPMIAMWDADFAAADPEIDALLARGDGIQAFERMHAQLDRVWRRCVEWLAPGGFICVNIGDAVRTIDGAFRLFSNHGRIAASLESLGLTPLPDILWRKPTNAPNKFMGSGMLPAGAYVTYEHEYILIFRKGGKRVFATDADRARRRRSAFFWEERNAWFSDLWEDLRGVRQDLVDSKTRQRSAAFPLELPLRLIQMYSCLEDVVLDPFGGVGTTALAAAATGRSSVTIERDPELCRAATQLLEAAPQVGEDWARLRLRRHLEFAAGRELRHRNRHLNAGVTTSQETDLVLHHPRRCQPVEGGVRCTVAPANLAETPDLPFAEE